MVGRIVRGMAGRRPPGFSLAAGTNRAPKQAPVPLADGAQQQPLHDTWRRVGLVAAGDRLLVPVVILDGRPLSGTASDVSTRL